MANRWWPNTTLHVSLPQVNLTPEPQKYSTSVVPDANSSFSLVPDYSNAFSRSRDCAESSLCSKRTLHLFLVLHKFRPNHHLKYSSCVFILYSRFILSYFIYMMAKLWGVRRRLATRTTRGFIRTGCITCSGQHVILLVPTLSWRVLTSPTLYHVLEDAILQVLRDNYLLLLIMGTSDSFYVESIETFEKICYFLAGIQLSVTLLKKLC